MWKVCIPQSFQKDWFLENTNTRYSSSKIKSADDNIITALDDMFSPLSKESG